MGHVLRTYILHIFKYRKSRWGGCAHSSSFIKTQVPPSQSFPIAVIHCPSPNRAQRSLQMLSAWFSSLFRQEDITHADRPSVTSEGVPSPPRRLSSLPPLQEEPLPPAPVVTPRVQVFKRRPPHTLFPAPHALHHRCALTTSLPRRWVLPPTAQRPSTAAISSCPQFSSYPVLNPCASPAPPATSRSLSHTQAARKRQNRVAGPHRHTMTPSLKPAVPPNQAEDPANSAGPPPALAPHTA